MPKKTPEEGQESKKAYDVRLKPGHPTGEFHRAGLTFSVNGAVRLDVLPEAVRMEPWLIVSEVDAQ
jgi:hypothetical protein